VQMIAQDVALLHAPMTVHIIAVVFVEDYVDLCVATLAVLQVGKILCFQKSENQEIAGKMEL